MCNPVILLPPPKSGFESYCSNTFYLFCSFQNQFFCFFLHVDKWYLRKRTVIATKWFLLQMFLLRCFLEKVEMPQHHYQLNDLLLDSYGFVVSVSWVSKTMSLQEVSNNDEPTISRELVVRDQQRWANDKSWPTTMSWRWVVTIFESERWSKKKTVGKFFEKKQKRFFSRQKNFMHLFSSSSRKRFFSLERLFLMSKFSTSRASFS